MSAQIEMFEKIKIPKEVTLHKLDKKLSGFFKRLEDLKKEAATFSAEFENLVHEDIFPEKGCLDN